MTTLATQSPHRDHESVPKQAGKFRIHLAAWVGVAVLGAGGLGVGLALALGGSASQPTAPMYSYYHSMMSQFGASSMMGGSSGSMMGTRGYQWMMGGTGAPGWMRGDAVPGYMMGTDTDPGKVMGRLFANAPGPQVSPAEATRLGNEIPVGATVDTAKQRITFSAGTVHLVVLASPSGNPDETFRIAGLVNPTIEVKVGAQVSMEVVNADSDTAHGLVVSRSGSGSSWMPMMTAAAAFGGTAVWFLGNPTSAGMHSGTVSFTAGSSGAYQYLCPVPGHAQKGMVGTFLVTR